METFCTDEEIPPLQVPKSLKLVKGLPSELTPFAACIDVDGKKRVLRDGYVFEQLPHGVTRFPVLRTQCQHVKRNGEQCTFMTTYDYQLCDKHLLTDRHLLVAKSRLPNAGCGLFAVNPRLLDKGYLACMRTTFPRDPPPVIDSANVFNHGDVIGGVGCTFRGEFITNRQYHFRYGSRHAEYVVGMETHCHDETFARTCLSYSNDGVRVDDTYLRRNFVHANGTHVVWHDLSWKFIINARCDVYADITGDKAHKYSKFACLQAIGSIDHGEEIMWPYSGTCEPSKFAVGLDNWCTSGGEILDPYWYGAFLG